MLTKLAVLALSSALLLAACTGPQGTEGPVGADGTNGATGAKGDAGTPGTPGAPGTPGDPGSVGPPGTPGTPGTPGGPGDKGDPGPVGPPGAGLAGVVYSDWKAATSPIFVGFKEQACTYQGNLEDNAKLSETAYQNGIILVYQKTSNITTTDIKSIPFSDGVNYYSLKLSDKFYLNYEVRSSLYKSDKDCLPPSSTEAFFNTAYRYVLIPAPSAKSKLAPSSLTTPLERASAWYGLFDLSYASVKQRFNLKD